MSSATPPELVKWYTRARRFPQLIGRTPDGAKIWGGPYTFTQAIGAGVLALIAINTMGLWANYGFIGNTLLLVAVTYGGVLLLGRVPVGARSPISLITGSAHAAFAPPVGRLGGRAFRPRRPHVVRHRFIVTLEEPKPRRAALPRQRTTLPVRPKAVRPKPVRPKPVRPKPVRQRPASSRSRTAKPATIQQIPVEPTPVKQSAVTPTHVKPATQPAEAPTAAPRPNLTGVQTLLAQGRTPAERD